ncbi:MAG: serine protease [Rhodoferax sp.]
MQRRMMLLGAGARAAASVVAAGLPWSVGAQAPSHVLSQALDSVVKVEADRVVATGFLWPDTQHVVTALHVIDNSSRIVVNFVDSQARIVDTQQATVERVLQGADLVLLRLQRAQSRKPLELARQGPSVDQVMSALGFPLNIAGQSSTNVRLRFGGKNLRSMLPPKVLAQIKEYPDPNLEILNLEGNLVPGLSGAPLLDTQGRVCGIGDGGLEEGAVGICWGIPAAQLENLLTSKVQRTPNANKLSQLFSADLQASVGQAVGSRTNGLTKLRTRSYSQLSASVDDGLGLAQLTQFFAMFNPAKFNYDIYQNDATGASVALPAGVSVTTDQTFLVARPDEPALSIKMRVSPVANEVQAQANAVRFERDLAGLDRPDTVIQNDSAWSNLRPVQRGSLLVWRRAALISLSAGGFPQPRAYLFEALATNGRGFLGVAAINEDMVQSTQALEQNCIMGGTDPRCPQVYARRRKWAQMVLGVQFSSFPL